jgi:replicative DNA helicase
VLGSLLDDDGLFYETQGLFEHDFFSEAHGIIYRRMQQMLRRRTRH